MTKSELLALIDGKPTAPERIYNWQYNQMSIARHYGGLKYMGHDYTIAEYEDRSPLVRADVLAREAKDKSAKRTAERAAIKARAVEAQAVLL